MRSAQTRVSVAAAGLLLIVAGCAADPTPSDTEPLPDPTPTPTYVQPDAPAATLPLNCADFGSLAAIQSSFAEPLQVRVDETSAPEGAYRAEFTQAGGLTCIWGGDGRTDASYDAGLTLNILGDAADAYAAYGPPDGSSVQDTLGDDSAIDCYAFVPGYQCFGQVLVGEYWIDAVVSDSANVTSTADAVAMFTAVVGSVVDKVRAAGEPRPAWIPPAGSFDGAALCSDPTAVAAALGVAPGELSVQVLGANDTLQIAEGTRRSGSSHCTWGTASSTYAANLTALAGGAWAMKRYLAQPTVAIGGLQQAPQPVTLPNTESAILSCGDGCVAAMVIGGSIVYLSLGDTYDAAQATAQAAAFSAAVAA
jgi:hypothetical protein